MKHSFQKLTSIVHDHNKTSLSTLQSDQPWLAKSLPPLPSGHASSISRFPSRPVGQPSISGTRKKIPFPPPLAGESCISLNQNQDIVAVFSVIDGSTQNIEKIEKVALCVGINYGQGVYYLKDQLLTEPKDLKAMRRNLSSVLGMVNKPTPNFHLIAANFFPWISQAAWGSIAASVVDEAVALRACGYNDPVSVISTLVRQIQPEYLIFHGIGNCVPILGLQVLRATGHGSQATCLFTGNLAYATTANYILMP